MKSALCTSLAMYIGEYMEKLIIIEQTQQWTSMYSVVRFQASSVICIIICGHYNWRDDMRTF